jgi:hypothetical protein
MNAIHKVGSGAGTLLAALLFTVLVGSYFRLAWHSPPASLAYNVPIAAPFAALFLDRLLPARAPTRRLLLDLAVVGLALLRVFAPPLPWASGHALFTAYAAGSARRWPLRAFALAVLLEVVYMKLFVTGGVWSLLTGLLVGGAAALAGRTISAAPRADPPPRPSAGGPPSAPRG